MTPRYRAKQVHETVLDDYIPEGIDQPGMSRMSHPETISIPKLKEQESMYYNRGPLNVLTDLGLQRPRQSCSISLVTKRSLAHYFAHRSSYKKKR